MPTLRETELEHLLAEAEAELAAAEAAGPWLAALKCRDNRIASLEAEVARLLAHIEEHCNNHCSLPSCDCCPFQKLHYEKPAPAIGPLCNEPGPGDVKRCEKHGTAYIQFCGGCALEKREPARPARRRKR